MNDGLAKIVDPSETTLFRIQEKQFLYNPMNIQLLSKNMGCLKISGTTPA
ncbi:MAG TPA: hypothetical protein PK439_10780 [Nitrosomonas sp.]|nr:hypothetical protein [Nitrosomonas sp.]HRB21821.1 hypothetical protein [Nitrosomonas sp.]HRB46456.1 hypothetical protein [Nitrosomonas sp.]